MSWPDRVLIWGLSLLALPSLIDITGRATIRYDKFVLGVLLVALAVGLTEPRRTNVGRVAWAIVPLWYLCLKGMAFVLGDHPAALSDFIQAYKAYCFLPLIGLAIGRAWFTPLGIALLAKTLIVLFAIKYATVLAMGGDRPIVWYENNFEMMAPIGLIYLARHHLGSRRAAWVGGLVAITVMSGSRTSVIELAFLLYLIYFDGATPRLRTRLIVALGGAWAVWYVVMSRILPGGIGSVDRLYFLRVFRDSTADWGPTQWLFGTQPLSALPGSACSRLAFYSGLFSGENKDTCYSVVLHAYALRGIWDHGVVGFALLLALVIAALRRAGATTRDCAAILGIGVINSLSVSSFNSEFYLLLMITAVATRGLTPKEARNGRAPSQGPRVPLTTAYSRAS